MRQELSDAKVKAAAPLDQKFADYFKANASTSLTLKKGLDGIFKGNEADFTRFFNKFIDDDSLYEIFSVREHAVFFQQTNDFGYMNTYAKTLQPILNWMIDYETNSVSQAFIDGINSIKIVPPLYTGISNSEQRAYSFEEFTNLLQQNEIYKDCITELPSQKSFTKDECLAFLKKNKPSNYQCILNILKPKDPSANPAEKFAYYAQKAMELCFNEMILFVPETVSTVQKQNMFPIIQRAQTVYGALGEESTKSTILEKLNYPEWHISSHDFEASVKALVLTKAQDTSSPSPVYKALVLTKAQDTSSPSPVYDENVYKEICEKLSQLQTRYDFSEETEPDRHTQFYGEFTYHYLKKIDDFITFNYEKLTEDAKEPIKILQDNIRKIISNMEFANKKVMLNQFIRRNPELMIGVITTVVVAVLSVFTFGAAIPLIPFIYGVVSIAISAFIGISLGITASRFKEAYIEAYIKELEDKLTLKNSAEHTSSERNSRSSGDSTALEDYSDMSNASEETAALSNSPLTVEKTSSTASTVDLRVRSDSIYTSNSSRSNSTDSEGFTSAAEEEKEEEEKLHKSMGPGRS